MTGKHCPTRHYAKSRRALKVALRRSPLQRQHHARRFLETRLRLRLTQSECAELLEVTPRTLRYWEAGAVRIPHAAYRLLRVLGGGRYLDHPAWKSFSVRADVLVTPEGHEFQAADLVWWSLLVRQAREYRNARAQLRALQAALPAPVPHGALATVATVAGAALCASCSSPDDVDHLAAALVASADRDDLKTSRSSLLPSSNRGVSETERDASESVPSPSSSAATLSQTGVAAPARPRVPA